MASKEIEREAAQLRGELNRHNYLYYVEAKPEISDREYDRMMERLTELEAQHPELVTPDSPTQRVGGQPLEGFATVRHVVPMLSIDNTYSYDEVREWDARVRRGLNRDEPLRYVVELKVDGVAVSLRYEHGRFVLGATRGDGERGDDITANLKTVREVPLVLQNCPASLLEVRGEVYMTNSELVRLNELRRAAEELPFANPRNSTAGSLKLLDSKLCGQRRLRFVSHGLGEYQGIDERSYYCDHSLDEELGNPGQPLHGLLRHDRPGHRARPALERSAELARLPDRRPGREGRRPQSARAAGRAEQEPALDHRLQVRGRAGRHAAGRDHGSGRQDGQADAGRRARAGPAGRHDGQARQPAQRRRDRAQGRPYRRRRRDPEGRRDHPPGRPRRGRRPQGRRDAPSLPHGRAPVAARRSNGRPTRSTSTARTRRHDAPSSSRSGSGGTPTATPWTSTDWGRS